MSTRTVGKDSMKHHCPKKKEFYSSLAMEDITDTDYKTHRKGPEDLKIQNVGVYHDLCEQSDRL